MNVQKRPRNIILMLFIDLIVLDEKNQDLVHTMIDTHLLKGGEEFLGKHLGQSFFYQILL